MEMVFLVFMGAVFVNNFVLSQFLGVCPFIGVSRKVETAFGMGVAVTFVMALAAAAGFVVYRFVLVPLNITYLATIVFVLIIACLVQLVEIFLKKASPSLYASLGIFLPLMTTNCAILGVVLLNREHFTHDFLLAIIHSVGAAIGFTLAIVLLASLREKMEFNNIPAPFKGLPSAMLTTGFMAIAFMGFSGLINL